MRQGEILLEVVRNEMVESIHSGHLLITDKAGKSILELGDLDSLIYPRSAIKAIQSAGMLRAGLEVSPKQLALICASHAGSSEHFEVATSILAGAGLSEKDLQNTKDKPLGISERLAWAEREPTSLAANCSGKHAGMLATCRVNGWDISNYKVPSHPLQQLIKREFENLIGTEINKVGIDGCGAPLFALSLRDLANAFRNLVQSSDDIYKQVINACRSNPIMVAGLGRLPTILMSKVTGLFVKDGAEGVMVIATDSGEVIVWKMSEGSQRGAATLALASLSHLQIEVELEREVVLGGGQVVGEIRASKLVRHG
jgi:L-asparaginase II